MSALPADDDLDAEEVARGACATLARRSLAHFVRQAIDAGEVDGISRVEWGPHLDAICLHTQRQLEAWLVCNGPGPVAVEWQTWAREHAEMIGHQREAWERTDAAWEDGQPDPWLRYPIVQNELDNAPPGTLKSTIVMVCANAWIWLWEPRFSFGALSGIDANVGRDSRACRDLVRSSWYRETFRIAWIDHDCDPELGDEPDIEIKSDADAVEAWATTAGGKRLSRTFLRGLTGTHVDGIFADDPDDADKVYGEADRVRPQNRWTRAIANRVNDEHRSIRRVMQQVVHPEGMTTYLLSLQRWAPATPKGWMRFCIAAEYGYGPESAPQETPWGWRDWRTTKGQTMHPRLSAGVLAHARLNMPGGYEWQYNQNEDAGSIGSGMFERRHARFFLLQGMPMPTRRRPEGCVQRGEMPPRIVKLGDIDRKTLSIDAANSLDPKPGAKVSAVGLVVGGCLAEERLWLDDRTRVLGVSATYRAVFEICAAWDLDEILVELKALGSGVIDELTRSIRRGWYLDEHDAKVPLVGPDGKAIRARVKAVTPGKEDKVQRAHAWLPSWEQGLVLVMDGADWLYPQVDENRKTLDEGTIGEVCSFPASRRKDRVDSWSQFMSENRGKSDTRHEWQAMRRLGVAGMRGR